MSTVFEESDRTPKDAILLFEIGMHTQTARENFARGINKTRLNKTLATVLWHWEQLQETEDYRGIHNWGIYHMPFRFGEVVFRPLSKSGNLTSNAFNILLIDRIIRGDPHMSALIRIVSQAGFEEDVFDFPLPNLKEYNAVKEAADIEDFDLDLARALALLYASADTEHLAILATCSNEDLAYKAMEAEMLIWHHDVNEIFNKLFEYRHQPIMAQRDITECLNAAFKCGQQIGIKRKWYSKAGNAASHIRSLIRDRFPEDLLQPLSKVENKEPSDRMKVAEDTAEILTGFVGYTESLLVELGLRVSLDGDSEAIAQRFVHRLFDTKFTQHQEALAHEVAGSRNLIRAHELLEHIQVAYKAVQGYLFKEKLPEAYSGERFRALIR